MLDGQNLFDACLSDVSHHEWGFDETVYRLVADGKIPAMIVVGVDHAGKDRAQEYLPYRDYIGNPDMAEPEGKRFPDFLVNEVMPLVNGQYRTLTGPAEHRPRRVVVRRRRDALCAHGAAEQLRLRPDRKPDDVDRHGPARARHESRSWRCRSGYSWGLAARKPTIRSISDKMIGLIRQVQSNFQAAGYDDSTFRFVVDPDAVHTETAWAKRLPDALTFLFGDWKETPAPAH